MQDILTTLIDLIDANIQSEDTKKEIYEEFIPTLVLYDSDLADALTKENELFAEVYHEMYVDSENYIEE